MGARHTVLFSTVVVFAALLAGCDSGGPERSERQTVDAYVAALNQGDPSTLAKLAPPGYEGVEDEVRQIVKENGGKGLKVASVAISHDFGPDVASALIVATDKSGNPFRETLQLDRDGEMWRITLGHKPGTEDRESSAP
ncbi:hypothetical protein [Streptomyces sp. NPDC002785]|uniref:hypothetical protein n=1 Tax=Streptomyces sp. NPDC002785 TaxID=3154543 RepID=UPI003320D65C